MKETDFVLQIRKSIEHYYPNAYCRKIVMTMYTMAGIPDLLCCINGRFVGIECKVANNKASLLQKENLRKILKSGGISYILIYHSNMIEIQNVEEDLIGYIEKEEGFWNVKFLGDFK